VAGHGLPHYHHDDNEYSANVLHNPGTDDFDCYNYCKSPLFDRYRPKPTSNCILVNDYRCIVVFALYQKRRVASQIPEMPLRNKRLIFFWDREDKARELVSVYRYWDIEYCPVSRGMSTWHPLKEVGCNQRGSEEVNLVANIPFSGRKELPSQVEYLSHLSMTILYSPNLTKSSCMDLRERVPSGSIAVLPSPWFSLQTQSGLQDKIRYNYSYST
jgi:hypothetical protein